MISDLLPVSPEHVNFLDLTLADDADASSVITTIYRKLNMGNTLLKARSCHPRHTIHSITLVEYIRTKRAYSNSTILEEKLHDLDNRLLQQGYNKWLLRKSSVNIKSRTHESLLFDNKTTKRNETLQTLLSCLVHLLALTLLLLRTSFSNIYPCWIEISSCVLSSRKVVNACLGEERL